MASNEANDCSNSMGKIAEEIIEASPSFAIRVTGDNGKWKTLFVTKNVSKYGYSREDFMSGRVTMMDIIHPEDLPELVASIDDKESRGIFKYNHIYRIVTTDGRSVWISDDSTVVHDADGNFLHSDCIISDYTETKRHIEQIEDYYRQHRVLKEILQGLHDADTEKAVQIILDSTGVYLDISRVILFEDSADHLHCRAIHEWCNSGISSMGEFDIDYLKDIPEIYHDLHEKGYRIINYGDIPKNSTEEFDEEGVIAAAIFSVFINQEHFGFICFDECVKERFWPEDTIRFLQTVSNLVAPAILRKRNEELTKSLARQEGGNA